MKITFGVLLITLLFSTVTQSKEVINANSASEKCDNNNAFVNELIALKKKNFELKNNDKKQKLSIFLLNCLASPKPQIRDGVAYSALSQ
ncbi:hypothetical protein D5R81_13590 [Parashewanella spongiae]|uniref:Uncharacterized protein n=1 Tax=Parashewanella spongiae TaxID=342950 RepID=A0A3A6TL22_9GAMM|nr:hypothetical protein [Parashewanella spongiae]MCL1079237.1 hypothetical protein [Parashewanella spongiae]RJY11075.1 hypothetical protein D5R81_13590 [Parashewanella spongiae]